MALLTGDTKAARITSTARAAPSGLFDAPAGRAWGTTTPPAPPTQRLGAGSLFGAPGTTSHVDDPLAAAATDSPMTRSRAARVGVLVADRDVDGDKDVAGPTAGAAGDGVGHAGSGAGGGAGDGAGAGAGAGAASTPTACAQIPTRNPVDAADDGKTGQHEPQVVDAALCTPDEDPLSLAPDSTWARYFADTDLRTGISKDVERTNTGLHFFQGHRMEAFQRILHIYAKLNLGVRYIQGMNELLAPLFYVVMHDPDPSLSEDDKEADCFRCFAGLMSRVRDVFIQDNDVHSSGIQGVMAELGACLGAQDPELSRHLASIHLDPIMYGVRWYTTMLAREFALPDTLELWDVLLSDASTHTALTHCCVALLRGHRESLVASDFAACMHTLQQHLGADCRRMLADASLINEACRLAHGQYAPRGFSSLAYRLKLSQGLVSLRPMGRANVPTDDAGSQRSRGEDGSGAPPGRRRANSFRKLTSQLSSRVTSVAASLLKGSSGRSRAPS